MVRYWYLILCNPEGYYLIINKYNNLVLTGEGGEARGAATLPTEPPATGATATAAAPATSTPTPTTAEQVDSYSSSTSY